MIKHEIGKLEFDIYYDDGWKDDGLFYEFELLKPDGKNEKVFVVEAVEPMHIDRVLAELYADGWQMIQLTEEYTYDDDDHEDIAVWFREAYFHRPLALPDGVEVAELTPRNIQQIKRQIGR